jgi:hypothetical protein
MREVGEKYTFLIKNFSGPLWKALKSYSKEEGLTLNKLIEKILRSHLEMEGIIPPGSKILEKGKK